MTVIERMARAIWDDREQHQNERCRQSWERGSELARQFAMDHARAALTALREPIDGEDRVVAIQRRVMIDNILAKIV